MWNPRLMEMQWLKTRRRMTRVRGFGSQVKVKMRKLRVNRWRLKAQLVKVLKKRMKRRRYRA